MRNKRFLPFDPEPFIAGGIRVCVPRWTMELSNCFSALNTIRFKRKGIENHESVEDWLLRQDKANISKILAEDLLNPSEVLAAEDVASSDNLQGVSSETAEELLKNLEASLEDLARQNPDSVMHAMWWNLQRVSRSWDVLSADDKKTTLHVLFQYDDDAKILCMHRVLEEIIKKPEGEAQESSGPREIREKSNRSFRNLFYHWLQETADAVCRSEKAPDAETLMSFTRFFMTTRQFSSHLLSSFQLSAGMNFILSPNNLALSELIDFLKRYEVEFQTEALKSTITFEWEPSVAHSEDGTAITSYDFLLTVKTPIQLGGVNKKQLGGEELEESKKPIISTRVKFTLNPSNSNDEHRYDLKDIQSSVENSAELNALLSSKNPSAYDLQYALLKTLKLPTDTLNRFEYDHCKLFVAVEQWQSLIDRGHGLYANSMITPAIAKLGEFIAYIEIEKLTDEKIKMLQFSFKQMQAQLRGWYAHEMEIDPNNAIEKDTLKDLIVDTLTHFKNTITRITDLPIIGKAQQVIVDITDSVAEFKWPLDEKDLTRCRSITSQDQLRPSGALMSYDVVKDLLLMDDVQRDQAKKRLREMKTSNHPLFKTNLPYSFPKIEPSRVQIFVKWIVRSSSVFRKLFRLFKLRFNQFFEKSSDLTNDLRKQKMLRVEKTAGDIKTSIDIFKSSPSNVHGKTVKQSSSHAAETAIIAASLIDSAGEPHSSFWKIPTTADHLLANGLFGNAKNGVSDPLLAPSETPDLAVTF